MKSSKLPRTTAIAASLGVVALAAAFTSGKLRAQVAERRRPGSGRLVGEDGRRLHYVQQGSGPDVVLIHGAAVSLGDLRPLMDALAGSYRVTAFDRPGHGYSDPAPREAAPLQQAEKLRAAVVALGIERPILIGHSLGGAVALAYGAAFREETSGVVALAPLAYPGWGPGHLSPAMHALPFLGSALSHTLFTLTDPLLMRLAPRLMFAPQAPTQRFKDEAAMALSSRPVSMRADGVDMMAASAALSSSSRGYETYPVPVHVVVGDRDRVLKPARQALRLAEELPGAKLTVLPGLGHMLHHFDPDSVRRAVDDMRGLPARAAGPLAAAA